MYAIIIFTHFFQYVMFFLWLSLLSTTAIAQTATTATPGIGISDNVTEVQQKFGRQAKITCGAYGNPPPVIEWWLFRPATYLGRIDTATGEVHYGNVSLETRERSAIIFFYGGNDSDFPWTTNRSYCTM